MHYKLLEKLQSYILKIPTGELRNLLCDIQIDATIRKVDIIENIECRTCKSFNAGYSCNLCTYIEEDDLWKLSGWESRNKNVRVV